MNTEISRLRYLTRILKSNEEIYETLRKATELGIKNYYIGGGCITQSVWNYLSENELLYGISDIDLVYFEPDLSAEADAELVQRIKDQLKGTSLAIDPVNEAPVHTWYGKQYGKEIAPYETLESAIGSFATTATAIGVRLENNQFKICAPHGLSDLFSLVVKPNKGSVTEDYYLNKSNQWKAKWPKLNVLSW